MLLPELWGQPILNCSHMDFRPLPPMSLTRARLLPNRGPRTHPGVSRIRPQRSGALIPAFTHPGHIRGARLSKLFPNKDIRFLPAENRNRLRSSQAQMRLAPRCCARHSRAPATVWRAGLMQRTANSFSVESRFQAAWLSVFVSAGEHRSLAVRPLRADDRPASRILYSSAR